MDDTREVPADDSEEFHGVRIFRACRTGPTKMVPVHTFLRVKRVRVVIVEWIALWVVAALVRSPAPTRSPVPTRPYGARMV